MGPALRRGPLRVRPAHVRARGSEPGRVHPRRRRRPAGGELRSGATRARRPRLSRGRRGLRHLAHARDRPPRRERPEAGETSCRRRLVILAGYEPLLELATGGMATLYVALRTGAYGFEHLVALKRVHRRLLAQRDVFQMFMDEARIASLIGHPNVVPVVDVPEVTGELVLVLEYVESVALADLLAAARRAGERVEPSVVSRI